MRETTRTVLIALGIALLVVVVVSLLFMASRMNGMMGGVMGQPNPLPWPGVVIAVSWLLVAAGIVLLLIWAARRLGGWAKGNVDEPPLTILQRRYARGEIGPEEYERIRGDLLRDRGSQ